jgi:hypothetical protein
MDCRISYRISFALPSPSHPYTEPLVGAGPASRKLLSIAFSIICSSECVRNLTAVPPPDGMRSDVERPHTPAHEERGLDLTMRANVAPARALSQHSPFKLGDHGRSLPASPARTSGRRLRSPLAKRRQRRGSAVHFPEAARDRLLPRRARVLSGNPKRLLPRVDADFQFCWMDRPGRAFSKSVESQKSPLLGRPRLRWKRHDLCPDRLGHPRWSADRPTRRRRRSL